MEKLFFDSTDNLLRIVVTAPILYVVVIAFIRISGKRSTSQMNNFDWVVTVAMGSLVASGVVLKDVTILEVTLAIALLLILQYAVTKTLLYSRVARVVVKAQPRLVVHRGEFLLDAMRDERLTEGEVLAAIRGNGITRFEDVAAVILETDATMSVITSKPGLRPIDTLRDVRGELAARELGRGARSG